VSRCIRQTERTRRRDLSVVIAADVNPTALRHQEVARSRGIERTRHMVTKVHHHIGRETPQIGNHGFQRTEIAVYVGYGRNPHVDFIVVRGARRLIYDSQNMDPSRRQLLQAATLTAIMARISMDLGREVTWKEVVA
jgi:hypothetical protein